jgi:2-polyprenyl-3-methyl-5-hydroxy-6-metoxy-1,4-benzoquinol methylase
VKFKRERLLNGYIIVRCLNCDFEFINPRPSEGAIQAAYNRESKDLELSFTSLYEPLKALEDYSSWTAEYTLNILFAKKRTGSFLDIGAGHGWAVKYALSRGYDAHGFEFGDNRLFEQDPLISDRIYRDKESISKSGKLFDVIHLSAVLEHTYNPRGFLEYWITFLKKDGIFMISALPNMNSIFIKLGLDSWDGNVPPHHLNYFTPRTLKKLLTSIECETLGMFTMGVPLSFGPDNIGKQKLFETKYWGDNIRGWPSSKDKKDAGGLKRNRNLAAALNHLIRLSGYGANIHAIFTKSV